MNSINEKFDRPLDYLPMPANLYETKAIKLAAEILKIEPAQAAGHLLSLWMLAGRSHLDGDLPWMEARDFAAACRWAGKPTLIVYAALKAGWVVHLGDQKGWRICRWQEFAGRALKTRKLRVKQHQAFKGKEAMRKKCNADCGPPALVEGGKEVL